MIHNSFDFIHMIHCCQFLSDYLCYEVYAVEGQFSVILGTAFNNKKCY